MTSGHKHRTVVVHQGGWAQRLLTTPVLTRQPFERADRSRWTYGPVQSDGKCALTPLGVLHSLVGLTLDAKPRRR